MQISRLVFINTTWCFMIENNPSDTYCLVYHKSRGCYTLFCKEENVINKNECFVDRGLSFCPFSFAHCAVCPSI